MRITVRLLQSYLFFSSLELLFDKVFGVDTVWKPYRIVGIFAILAVMFERVYLKRKIRLDLYDKLFISILLIGCLLACVWLIAGATEPKFVFAQFLLVLLPFLLYFAVKLHAGRVTDLAPLMRAYVAGAVVNACYVIYQVFVLEESERLPGLSETGPDLALHSGLALGFVLLGYQGRKATITSRLIRMPPAGLLCFALATSGTRAAWLGVVAAGVVLFCVTALSSSPKSTLVKLLAAAAVLASVIDLAGPTALEVINPELAAALGQRLTWDALHTGSGRTDIWAHSLSIASEYCYIGGGFSGFMQGAAKHISEFAEVRQEYSDHGVVGHNVFLEMLVDYGPGSLFIFCACITALFITLLQAALTADRSVSAFPMLYSLIFITVCGLFQNMFSAPDFWICMAFVTVFIRSYAQVTIPTTGSHCPVRGMAALS